MSERRPRRWAELTGPELYGLDGEVGLVPVGATEQHGPHLPSGTDTIIASYLCDQASTRSGAIVLPPVSVAVSYGHGTTLSGTLSVSPQTLISTAREIAEWSATSSLTRVIFVNAHFGNSAALGVATDHLRLFRPDIQVGVADWWSLTPEVSAAMTADGGDVHANCAETSVMLAIAPELVRHDLITTEADDQDRTGSLVFRYTAAALSRNGVTGSPSQASAQTGAHLVALAVEALCARVARARSEQPPLGRAPFPYLTSSGDKSWTPSKP